MAANRFATLKPDTLALLAALTTSLVVLTVFVTDLVLSRKNDLEAGELRLQHFSQLIAEHTARSLDAVDVLLTEMSTDLAQNQAGWQRWSDRKGWEYAAQRHSRALPHLHHLALFDQHGDQRFTSIYYSPPSYNVAGQPYFNMLAEKMFDTIGFGPYLSPNTGRYAYGLVRAALSGNGDFNGVVMANIELAYFQEFCWTNRLSDNFDSAIVNGEGKVVASCRPVDLGRHSTVIGQAAVEVLGGGVLAAGLPDGLLNHVGDYLVSSARVSNYPDLRVITLIPQASFLQDWHKRLLEFGILSALIVSVLLFSGWLVWRRTREMRQTAMLVEQSRIELTQKVEEATAELATQKHTAELANTAKSRFLAAASHDLRQPLHALSLFSADLLRQISLGNTSELPKLATQISTSCSVLGELMDSLLDISRLDVAGIRTSIASFPVQSLFSRLSNAFRRSAQAKGIQLVFRPTVHFANSDATLVEQILTNLISNAIRYTPGGGRVYIACRKRSGNQLQIDVRDSGIGIPEEHQRAIFGEFYQVGNAEREHRKGLGLGLSIVDRIAKALEAPITVRSRTGIGSCFSLRIPADLSALESEDSHKVGDSVLFVGHTEELLRAAHMAEEWGFNVETTQSPSVLAEKSGQRSIVVCDMEQRQLCIALGLNGNRLIVLLGKDSPSEPTGEGGHASLRLPLRPAKLRALLDQLSKTPSKSTL